jgi:hypothetical protein
LNLGLFKVFGDAELRSLNLGSFGDIDDAELRAVVDVDDLEAESGCVVVEELSNPVGVGVAVECLFDMLGEVFVVAESVQSAGMAELYNSGCTNHISPYKNNFENFQTISPRHFRAAKK